MNWSRLSDIISTALHNTIRDRRVRHILKCDGNELSLYPYLRDELQRALAASCRNTDPRYDVDVEWNRTPDGDTKEGFLSSVGGCGSVQDETIPDIVIHVQETDDHNLLAIEIQKDTFGRSWDAFHARDKLISYVLHPRNYKFALHLCFSTGPAALIMDAVLLAKASHHGLEDDPRATLRREFASIGMALDDSDAQGTISSVWTDLGRVQQELKFVSVLHDLSPLSTHDTEEMLPLFAADDPYSALMRPWLYRRSKSAEGGLRLRRPIRA